MVDKFCRRYSAGWAPLAAPSDKNRKCRARGATHRADRAVFATGSVFRAEFCVSEGYISARKTKASREPAIVTLPSRFGAVSLPTHVDNTVSTERGREPHHLADALQVT
jgi:hypothetical protein